MDYEKNKKYFKNFNMKTPLILIVIGVILAIIGFASSAGVAIVGILLALAGGGLIYYGKTSKMTDAQYDEVVVGNLTDMKQKALNKLGIDEDEVKEIDPITFDGYNFSGYNYVKKGDDNRWRTDKYHSVQLFFSANEVHVYKYAFSTTEEKKSESTEVYFYKDIVSVTTATDNVRIKEEDKKGKIVEKDVEFESFRLTTAGGTALDVSIRDIDGAQRSINAMRQLLKNKKMS